MERLKEQDLRAIVSFLRDMYAQPDLDTFARSAVARLTDVVAAHRVSYNEAHNRRGTLRVVIRPSDDIPPLTARQYQEHPMMQHFVKTGDGRAHRFSDFLSRDQLHATEMYQVHYRPAGVEHQMTVCLGSPKPYVVAFAVGRDGRDFSERDRMAMNLLRPHLLTGYERSSASARFRERMTLLARATDEASVGIVLFSAGGRITFMTRMARHWLRQYFPRRGRPSSRLPVAIAEWLARAEWCGSDVSAPPPAPLVVNLMDRHLTVRGVGMSGERALLLEECCRGGESAALLALGLSPREAEVLTHLARGSSNDGIAHVLGTSARTVAKHVERIHRKLDVDSRTAAAARAHGAWATPARLAD
jgi:DNA-binding CsgD family transcriptional regulator